MEQCPVTAAEEAGGDQHTLHPWKFAAPRVLRSRGIHSIPGNSPLRASCAHAASTPSLEIKKRRVLRGVFVCGLTINFCRPGPCPCLCPCPCPRCPAPPCRENGRSVPVLHPS